EISESLNTQDEMLEILEKSLNDTGEECIMKGFNPELDAIREDVGQALARVSSLEKERKKSTGISSLKIKYNIVIGYYYEVTKPNLHSVPAEFRRKQWLSNAERFSDRELDELEERIISGQQKIKTIEEQIISEIRDLGSIGSAQTRENGELLSCLDVLISFSRAASYHGYIRPELTDRPILEAVESRHPVVERNIREDFFVPNDIKLCAESGPSLAVITGPNMSGKSTYMRQAALLTVLGQSGSFVPAKSAKIGLTDRIFSRIGASDDISKGISTFMAEMIETANITNNVTTESFVILDEIGRGTSTYDGISIAWSVAEYLVSKIRCRTFFATHYHELTGLAEKYEFVENLNIAVKKEGDKILFLRKVEKGSSSHSYGIQVAKLAGLPREIVKKAKEILRILEKNETLIHEDIHEEKEENGDEELQNRLSEKLRLINPDNLTPMEALKIIFEMKKIEREDRYV
ncbi:DNA mismatch repair protein MutS, partial [candidate division WOR-3 bacterium]|nr:DNA mismatch repair protein MutS [candidate division WOR-3 bacterium]